MHSHRIFPFSIFAILLTMMSTVSVWADASTSSAETCAHEIPVVPQTNAEIRQWYNDQVAIIPTLNEKWIKQGISAEERAKRAYEIRHQARLFARDFMQNEQEVADLHARDQEKYGNPDGPTFEYLVEKNRAAGLEGDAVYEAIIGSSDRTNKEYNKKFGVTTEAESQ